MLKSRRAFFVFGVFVAALLAVNPSTAVRFKSSLYSILKGPFLFSQKVVETAADLWYFRQNANENRRLRKLLTGLEAKRFYSQEALAENKRLLALLELKKTIPPTVGKIVASRVIGRSPSTWNRALLIDKGTRRGIQPQMLVLSDRSVAGKVVEAAPNAAKVLLVTDPSSRIGVIVQRTRDPGILFGTFAGTCRVKYLPGDSAPQAGDIVETAGFGGFFPKGLAVGKIGRVWKEPGQNYLVAEVIPLADLNRLEEVFCVG